VVFTVISQKKERTHYYSVAFVFFLLICSHSQDSMFTSHFERMIISTNFLQKYDLWSFSFLSCNSPNTFIFSVRKTEQAPEKQELIFLTSRTKYGYQTVRYKETSSTDR